MRSRRTTELDRMSVAWSREKLLLVLGASAFFLIALAAGFVLAVASWFTTDEGRSSGTVTPGVTTPASEPGTTQAARDALASRPMRTTDPDGFTPAPLSTRVAPGPITLPAGTRADDLGVVTGFGRTPEGALAQLAAIDQAGFATGSMSGIRAVIERWAAPGGPTATTWSGVRAMKELLDSAQLPAGGSASMTVRLTPAMGQIKGSVGPDYTVVCVDHVLEASWQQSAMVAVADCQRMTWTGGRWLIAPGAEPFQATSVWPGTDAAIDAGWRDLG